MKLPALWILAAVAAGIGMAERWPAAPKLWAVGAGLGILVGGILAAGLAARRHSLAVAWLLALFAWVAIGGLAASVERASIPANHIARLISLGRVDPGIALRWRGRLREDPLTLPRGQRFEIDLEQVEASGAVMSTSGGLRVNSYRGVRVAKPPAGLRAGDRVEILVKARPPRDYLDPGAFDVKGLLAREKIDVLGSLRSGELLQLVDRPPPTISQRLARARGSLLARLDFLFVGHPERGAVARAMLLGDRSFVDSSVVLAFQKTAAYHVLVVAGLHVGALVIFFVVGGQAAAIFDAGDQRDDFAGAGGLCGDCAGSSADFAGGFDGGALFVRAAAISARGIVEYDCFGCADFADLETFLAGRFQFSTFVFGRGRDCGIGAALDGEIERTLSCGAESFGRRDAGYGARA
jgi:predicted membrane metal-binding protein